MKQVYWCRPPFLVEQDVVALGVFTRTSLRVLAIRKPGREHYTIKPATETVLDPGTILIVTGPAAEITKLVALAGDWV
jgi:uncharacterized protein with PhoU and TrkA domain